MILNYIDYERFYLIEIWLLVYVCRCNIKRNLMYYIICASAVTCKTCKNLYILDMG